MPRSKDFSSACLQAGQELGPEADGDVLRGAEGYEESAKRAEELHQAMLVQAFFNKTSSQLTEHGLLRLRQASKTPKSVKL